MEFPAHQVNALNPIGSGDALTAGIVRGLQLGESLVDSIKLGMECGAANALSLTSGTIEDVLG